MENEFLLLHWSINCLKPDISVLAYSPSDFETPIIILCLHWMSTLLKEKKFWHIFLGALDKVKSMLLRSVRLNCQKGGWKAWNSHRRIFLLQPCNKCQGGCWDVGLEFVAALNFKLERLNSVFHSGSLVADSCKNETTLYLSYLAISRKVFYSARVKGPIFLLSVHPQTCTNFITDEGEWNDFW